jgi:hypothetical protein
VLRIRLLLVYEGEQESLRSTRLTRNIAVIPAILPLPVSVSPVPGTLDSWQAVMPVLQAPSVASHNFLQHGTFDIQSVAVRSQYWQLVRPAETDAVLADVTTLPCKFVRLKRILQVEGHRKRIAEAVLRPAEHSESSVRPTMAEVEAQLDDCTLLLGWRLRLGSGFVPKVGVLTLPPVCMAKLVAASALRMTATVPAARATALHPRTLIAAGGLETQAEVLVRLRNCGARSISLCFECGELGARPFSHLVAKGGKAVYGGEGGEWEQHIVLSSRSRHQWLGGTRRHVLDLPAQAEQECRVRLSLTGAGSFSVDSFMCTWNVPEHDILGRVLPGERLELFVEQASEQ